MLQSMNFKHIFYFWVVAKKSSIRRASDILNVAPSSISEQMKILEYRLGVSLFDREQRSMNLTSQGKTLYNTLNEFFPTIEELFESLANHKSTDVKFLRIGLCPTLSSDLRFKLCFPYIEDYHYTVKVLQGENEFLVDAFDKDEVDILFTTNAQTMPHGKFEKFVFSKKKFVLVTNENIFSKLPKKNYVKELGNYKYINYTPDSDLHFNIFNFLHDKNISPTRIAEIDDINLIKNTIQNLDCFSVLPINSVKEEVQNKKLYTIGRPIKNLDSQIMAIYKPKFDSERFRGHLNNIKTTLKNA